MKQWGLLLACAVLVAATVACAAQPAQSADQLLELGEQYLLELDYDRALAQFLKVIEIEPMNARAYTGAAEAYIGAGDPERAAAILERGLSATGDEEIALMLERLRAQSEAVHAQETAPDPIARTLYEYLSAGDEQAALEFCLGDDFLAACAALGEGESRYYGGFDDEGMRSGIGAAYGDNGYVYYGSWSEGQRTGEAVYLNARADQDGDVRQTICRGMWDNDLPNGAMVSEVLYPTMPAGQGDRDRGARAVRSGHCIDGLWDGEVVFQMETASGEVHLWTLHVEAGRVDVLEQDEDRLIHAYCTSCNAGLSVGNEPFGLPTFNR